MVKLSDLFDIQYGNSFALNTLQQVEKGIAFVSRTSKNNGVSAIVNPVKGVKPFKEGLITVALSSMSVLEANIQPYEFYTGYHVAVLTPKRKMLDTEKLYYCLSIEHNKYRYYFGRQANRTLGELLVPDKAPKWIEEYDLSSHKNIVLPFHKKSVASIQPDNWENFKVSDLFDITTGIGPLIRNAKSKPGRTPLVSSTQFNNGIVTYTGYEPTHKGNVLTLAKNGSVGEVFYQSIDFVGTSDILVLNPRFKFNVYIAMFLIPILKKESHRYNYGRKWNKELLEVSYIKLPSNTGEPDLLYMENYIKTLRYSKNM